MAEPEPNQQFSDLPEKINPIALSLAKTAVVNEQELAARLSEQSASLDAERQNTRLKLESELARTNQEHQAKLAREHQDAQHNRRKEIGLILILFSIIAFILFSCVQVINSNKTSADDKQAAIAAISSVLTSTMTAIGGYIAGTKAKS